MSWEGVRRKEEEEEGGGGVRLCLILVTPS